ncbi:hypothetical protein T07_9224 [Trichinella nelsoni]|uniref:Uncharacterized protein n=1 Tax=Trichinella nelsoni TaxID=6336 RepID=A0A0V0S9Q5_9BILA|nr:hypothetical protein T07_9224 [Trichinella nelsoni]
MSNYWANAWYLFESLETSNSLYCETYSMLLRNYGILENNFINIASNCVPFIRKNIDSFVVKINDHSFYFFDISKQISNSELSSFNPLYAVVVE